MRKNNYLSNNKAKEYRIDLRGSGGKITAVRVQEREPGGEWQPCGDAFTEEHGVHFRKFSKVVTSVAKCAVPPFDLDAIIRKAEGSPRKKPRVNKKRRNNTIKVPAGNGSTESKAADSDW
jgi:hypothetical protein